MRVLSIEELTERFPDFRVAFVFAERLSIEASRSPALAADVAAAEQECRRRWGGAELSAIPGVAASMPGATRTAAAPITISITEVPPLGSAPNRGL